MIQPTSTTPSPIARSSGRARSPLRWRGLLAAVAGATLLAACGGGGDSGSGGGPVSCSVPDRQAWLRSYMDNWYYWYDISPSPSPAGYTSVETYFDALLYTGTDPDFPADRWSYLSDQAAYDRFFGEGRTMGYGVMVTGIEAAGQPDRPLLVRYVEPGSPAAAAGVLRGDQVLAVNGRPASELIAADDYSALAAAETGDAVTLQLDTAGGLRTVTLTSAVYTLVPVPESKVITTPDGRKMGYVMVKDMIDQAVAPIDAAFASFKAQGIQDVMIDLRYNGGGLVSVASKIASFPNGTVGGQVFTSLLYNDKQASRNNQSFRFASYANATGLNRVYVLTGPRTCSASELIINGLRPFVGSVVTVGDTTCGKPVGFLPQADGCGTVVSAVNFESVNASNEGRYFDGFEATCPVAEDFAQPLGGVNDPLRIAAEDDADGYLCSPLAVAAKRPVRRMGVMQAVQVSKVLGLTQPAQRQSRLPEPGDRGGLLPR